MKVQATGSQASDEVLVMSWSPIMDFLALGTGAGNIELRRLSTWEKVWQVPLVLQGGAGAAVLPERMTWHPEGLFLIVSNGCHTFVIDVECGKVVHSHELPVQISGMSWCSTQYKHSANDLHMHSSQSKREFETRRNTIKLQNVERSLSVLLIGTSNGFVYAYMGGSLLGFVIPVGEEDNSSRCHVLGIGSSPSLETFHFVTDEDSGSDDMILSFSQFRNEYLPHVAPIIGPLALRYLLFVKYWAKIQSEISNLNEYWSRLVDLYNNYMTLGGAKDLESARADYLELLLIGIRCAEMELFFGVGGKEKEVKKHIAAINTAKDAITDHLRAIKFGIVNLLIELNEIGGFMKVVSSANEAASSVIIDLRKGFTYLFGAVFRMQSLMLNFVEVILHFMNLVINTINSFEDFSEENVDTDKVIEFLETKVDKNIFEFLRMNGKRSEGDGEGAFGKLNFPEPDVLESKAEGSGGSKKNYSRFSQILHDLLRKNGAGDDHPVLLGSNQQEVDAFLENALPLTSERIKALLNSPVLMGIPFEADTHQIISLPKNVYLSPPDSSDSEATSSTSTSTPNLPRRKELQIAIDSGAGRTTICTLWSSSKVLVFEVDHKDFTKTLASSVLLYLSSPLVSVDLFSENYLTLVSVESGREGHAESCRSTVFQVHYREMMMSKAVSVDLQALRTQCGGTSVVPSPIHLQLPVECSKSGVPPSGDSHYISYALPIDRFTTSKLSVSGPRNAGALLGSNKKTVLLVDMEMDLNETPVDDDEDFETAADASG